LRGRFNVNALSGRLEGGYRVSGAIMDVTPYAAGQFISYRLPSYAEPGDDLRSSAWPNESR
jgi:hypothetical protein